MRKGVALSITKALMLLISIGFLVILIGLALGKYIETHSIIEGAEVERHVIILGNLYLSSGRLAVTDGNNIKRGVFDKEKLDKELINRGNFWDYLRLLETSDLFKEVSYPGSLITLGVSDLESSNSWFMLGRGYSTAGADKSVVIDFAKCLLQKIKIDLNTPLRMLSIGGFVPVAGPGGISRLPSLWDQQDFDGCTQAAGGKIGSSTKAFPVAIKDGNDVHIGIMTITLAE